MCSFCGVGIFSPSACSSCITAGNGCVNGACARTCSCRTRQLKCTICGPCCPRSVSWADPSRPHAPINSVPTGLGEPGDRWRLHPVLGGLQHLRARVDELHRCVCFLEWKRDRNRLGCMTRALPLPGALIMHVLTFSSSTFLNAFFYRYHHAACVAGFFSNAGGLCTCTYPGTPRSSTPGARTRIVLRWNMPSPAPFGARHLYT